MDKKIHQKSWKLIPRTSITQALCELPCWMYLYRLNRPRWIFDGVKRSALINSLRTIWSQRRRCRRRSRLWSSGFVWDCLHLFFFPPSRRPNLVFLYQISWSLVALFRESFFAWGIKYAMTPQSSSFSSVSDRPNSCFNFLFILSSVLYLTTDCTYY